jgi:MarR family transcriptional regulator, organic hydroperoxide resistance regulator
MQLLLHQAFLCINGRRCGFRAPSPGVDAAPSNIRHLMSDRLDLANYLPYLVNRLGSALVENFTATALAQHDLNIDAWRVMAVLSNQGAQRQIDLAELTSIEVSTLSRLITRMVKLGLVTRRRSESSNREVVVELAGKGRSLVKHIIPLAQRLEASAGAGIAANDMAVVKRTLRRMFENMAG